MASKAAPSRPGKGRSTASLARSTLLVAGVRGADFLLSFLVSVLLANRFGASGQLDAFFLARRTTVGFADTIRRMVAQVVMPTIIARGDAGQPLSIHGLPTRIYWFVGAFAALTLAGTFIPSALVTAFAPGFTGERHALTATMMAIMMPLLPIAVVASLLVAVLQANRKFLLSEGTNIIQRGLLVLVLAVAVPPLGIIAGAWTMLASGVIGVLILLAGAWSIVRRRPEALLGDKAPAAAAGLGGGVAAAIVLNVYFQASSLMDFAVASMVPEGGVAALEYGARLVSLVPGLVMSSLYTVLYPELVRAMQDPDPAQASAGLARFQRVGFFAQLPVSIGMMLGAELMVRILFGHGAFDERSILLAAGTTAGYAAAQIFLAPMSATTSAIYADPRASCLRDLSIIAVGGLVMRAAMLAIGAPLWGATGIAWAAAAATLGTFVLAQWIATRRFVHFDMTAQARDFARSGLCAGIAAAAGYALLRLGPQPEGVVGWLAMLIALGATVIAVFVGAALALRVPEVASAHALARAAIGRRFGAKR
ncbi:lipid II flippase MurJ [Sphingomonas endolithica]|uniref:lipid II flippase MurJ n=1 Tax=Sphingomonas endolithica TaxID=2972485 RepID=UPI0021AF96AC|nr:lipid II flippase MurJ [Sphingomonas sp. ZFBP2030]